MFSSARWRSCSRVSSTSSNRPHPASLPPNLRPFLASFSEPRRTGVLERISLTEILHLLGTSNLTLRRDILPVPARPSLSTTIFQGRGPFCSLLVFSGPYVSWAIMWARGRVRFIPRNSSARPLIKCVLAALAFPMCIYSARPLLFCNTRNFVWYGGIVGDGLRSVGAELLPPSKSACSILPAARHFTGRGSLRTISPARAVPPGHRSL